MAFDLRIWRGRIAQRMAGWRGRWEKARAAGVTSLYAFLSAMALWPVAEAAQQGEWAALAALGVAAGVGGNLLANQIRSWKDEVDAARQLAQAAEESEEVRAALDAILKQLDVVSQALGDLNKPDQEWLAEMLREEMGRMGSIERYEAVLIGSGAIAQGAGSAAAETGSIAVAGPVFGSIYQVYQASPGKPVLTEEEVESILGEYLRWVRNAYSKARLYGLESLPTAQGRPVRQLKDVFVPLTLRHFRPPRQAESGKPARKAGARENLAQAWVGWTERQRGDNDWVPLNRLLTVSDKIAIVGSAGSGKSTLLAYLVIALAEAVQGVDVLALPDPDNLPVPLVIPLRYYRDYLDLCCKSPEERLKNPRVGTLPGFIPWYLKRRSPALELSEDFFDRLLLGGGCLLMLDGLDEVVSRKDRGWVRQEVENLVNDIYPGNQVVVTAREAGYRDEAVFGDDFVRLDIQPLDEEQIRVLVANWCRQLYPGKVESRTEELMRDIRDINELRIHRDLPPLVSTPLMTTMVVSVKWGETRLPRERAKLYEAGVKVILQAQHVPEDPVRKEVVEWGGAWESQREWLSLLALEMHEGGQDGAAIREERLREFLVTHLEPEPLDRFVQAVRYRGGLLEERAEFFQFVHLTFQEFLVARLLAKQRQEGWPRLLPHIADPWWREVILLTYGFAQADYPPTAQAYLDWLSSLDVDGETRLAGLELAGAAVLELDRPDANLRRRQAEQLMEALVNPELESPSVLRAQAGDTLARLGDPRFRKDVWHLPNERLLGFVEVPEGPFLMGTQREDVQTLLKQFRGKRYWYEREAPQHKLTLPMYYIARYLVTVAQFRAFAKASGYQPEDPDSLLGVDNHPVVRVSWYEALKYCEWLTQTLRSWEGTPEPLAMLLRKDGWIITLPSEAQWEKAARGTDERLYPWGNDPDPNRANYTDTGIGKTSAVGCFPGGASPYGVEDLSGNVWEWCATKWESDYKDYKGNNDPEGDDRRVIRGGAFSHNAGFIRCTFRNWLRPDLRNRSLGLRLVVSPPSTSELPEH